ncbi:MAG: GNAT family N-acetyltransferase [Chitinophagaceae bacterium]|nr:GNAT family N-acetyltransferase [Chitinophagaceae bacterium]
MFKIVRTNTANPDFQLLVNELDKELAVRDGDDHTFYAQFNKTVNLNCVVLAYMDNIAIGCGAIRNYEAETMEVKRMYVPYSQRGKGIASFVLKELEVWAKELGCTRCILETGQNQPEAIALYKKNNYTIIPNYGQYKDVYNSVCFEKILGL